MIHSMYADNFKCLVNFECQFSNTNVILGTNGTGKSTVFDLLRRICNFATGKSPISIFGNTTLTRWQTRSLQTFELVVRGNGGTYRYRLEIEHEIGEDKQRVKLEDITFDGKPLYRAELGDLQLYRDNNSPGPRVDADWSQSSLPFLGVRRDNTKVTWLKNWFRDKVICLQIDPLHMKAIAGPSESDLDVNANNFVGWYRHRVSTDMSATLNLFNALKDMYDEFGGLKLEQEGGDMQHLFASFGVVEEEAGKPMRVEYSFGELSEGERCLAVLYALLQLLGDSEMTLCIDEPDNYLALQEIHPWLLAVEQQVGRSGSQAILISHHPEMIDFLAREHGLVFDRTRNGPTRVRPFAPDEDLGMSDSQKVARGWQ